MIKKQTPLTKPVKISKELESIIGKGPLSRTEINKKIWNYIKINKLQDENNKKFIIPNKELSNLFKSEEKIDMFQMTKKISEHIIK